MIDRSGGFVFRAVTIGECQLSFFLLAVNELTNHCATPLATSPSPFNDLYMRY